MAFPPSTLVAAAAEQAPRAVAASGGDARRIAELARQIDARAVIGAIAIFVLLARWVWLGVFLQNERARDIRDTEIRTANIARVVAESVYRTVERADDTLRLIGTEYRRLGAGIDIAALQRDGLIANDIFNWVGLSGADGYIIDSNLSPRHAYVGDRDSYRIHSEHDTGEIFIGTPHVGNRSGKVGVHLTRRISAADGSFAGVAGMALDFEKFSEFLTSLDPAQAGDVVLAGHDGIVRLALMRTPDAPALGDNLNAVPIFGTLRERGFLSSIDSDPGADGGQVVSAYPIPGYPLVAMVAISKEAALAGYRQQRNRYYATGAVTSVMIILLAMLVIRAFSRQLAIAGILRARETDLANTTATLRALSLHHVTLREEERGRIARRLHDELGQLLTGLKLSLSAMSLNRPDNARNTVDHNARLMTLVEQAMTATRTAVTELRPPALDQGLVAAIGWLVDEFRKRTGIECEFEAPAGDPELDDHRATALFRVVQESLTNIARHARAKSVVVRLDIAGGQDIRLSVVDDGVGFDAAARCANRCFGLLGMRERIAMLGGAIEIRSAPGDGTRVEVAVKQAEPGG